MLREFDYETLTFNDRRDIHNALAETTLKHIQRSGNLFSRLDFDIARNHSQQLEVTHLDPAPTDRTEVAALAGIAAERLFPCIKDAIRARSGLSDQIRTYLRDGTNLYSVSTHQQIQDIAIWGAAISDILEDDHWQEQNGHIISRGVTTIQAFGMAASEVLQKDGHVFMSFPRTETIEKLGFDERLIKTNNHRMRNEVDTWLRQDLKHRMLPNHLGRVLNVAWSGKTDKVYTGDDHKPKSVTFGSVGDATINMFKRGQVLPVVLWDGDEPFCEIGEFTTVKDRSDVERVQRWQAQSLGKFLGLPEGAVNLETAI